MAAAALGSRASRRARARALGSMRTALAHWLATLCAARALDVLARLRTAALRRATRRWWRAWRLGRRRELVTLLYEPLLDARRRAAQGARAAAAATSGAPAPVRASRAAQPLAEPTGHSGAHAGRSSPAAFHAARLAIAAEAGRSDLAAPAAPTAAMPRIPAVNCAHIVTGLFAPDAPGASATAGAADARADDARAPANARPAWLRRAVALAAPVSPRNSGGSVLGFRPLGGSQAPWHDGPLDAGIAEPRAAPPPPWLPARWTPERQPRPTPDWASGASTDLPSVPTRSALLSARLSAR